ncbi:MAG TPA: translocation/assembly module TamB domain-containing protein, partial [Haliscomenobacter sp.]|uniref:translocation/assembly module TamB domain-containing protein n=1 Tax=Haliscomenobacter sp. TaxID=2717303 RepID=UPI002CF11BFA
MPVQNFARKKIVAYLEQKLGTALSIKRLDISFPKMLVLEGVYVEDKAKDTLLAGHQLKVDIDLFQLLNNRVQINELVLKGITLKLKRQRPDQPFNYQFIVDAFATEEKNPSPDTSALIMAVDKLILDKTRLVFLDVLTGNDVDVYLGHAQLRIARIDASKLEYDVPQIDIRGLRGRVNQNTPLEITAVNTNPDPELVNEKPEYFKFTNQKTRLRDVDFAYSSEAAAINTNFKFKDLQVFPKTIDLEKNLIALHKLQLSDFTGRIDLNTQAEADLIKLTTQTDQELQTEYLPWKFIADQIRLQNSNLIYNDNTQAPLKSGMDYAHLNLQNLTLHGNDFLYNRDTIALVISKGQMWEGSGFRLEQLQADFRYTSREVRLEKLWIKTPGSTIRRRAIISYPSVAAIQKNPALMGLNLDIEHSRIQVKDLLTFVPFLSNQPAFKNPAAVFELNTSMVGSLARLNIRELQFSGFENTRADLSGTIKNATDPDHFSVDLNIRQLSTNRNDALLFVPPNSIPDSITLPESMSLSGTVKGSAVNLDADLDLSTPLGSAQVNGTISNAARAQKAAYNATVAVQALQVGTILQQPETLGSLSAKFTVRGKGYDLKTANVQAKGVVTSAVYNKYTYRDFQLDATLNKQQFELRGGMKDPNLHFTVQATGDLGGAYPAFAGSLNIDSIKTGPLHLTTDPIVYRGVIHADVPALNLDSLNGQIYLLHSLLISNNQRVNIDSIELVASSKDGQQSLDLSTNFAQARLSGQYKLTQLGDIFTQAIQPYFAIVSSSSLPDTSLVYDFSLQATVSDHVAIQAFLPDLQRMEDIVLDAHFSSASGWFANLSSPNIAYGANRISGLKLRAQTQGDYIRFTTSIAEIGNGETFVVQGTQLRASIANNQIDFALRISDRSKRDKYRLSGLFAQEAGGFYALSLRPDSLLLNYEPWSIDNDNQIRFSSTQVNAQHFDLSKNNQHLTINSRDNSTNSPLEILFEKFRLSTITGFVQVDSLFADGTLNGNIVLNDFTKQLNFTTDLTISNLAVEGDTIGDINAKISNPKANIFATDVSIKGRGNDVALTGNYYLKAEDKSTMDFDLIIKSLQWSTLEGISMGAIRNGKGYLTGNVKIGNKPTSPDLDGLLGFNETSMVISMLNSEFKIDNEQIIAVENKGLRFNSFTIRDSSENRLTINGVANTTNYLNYNFDLSLQAKNFRALNTTKKNNDLYYGQVYFDTNLKMTGTETAPVVDGTLRINELTRLTAVIPQEQPGVVERDGIVVFVDKDAPLNDALFLKQIDTLNKTSIQGMEVSVNIEVDKKAVLNLIVDEGNGDFLRLQGEAVLNGGIDKSGKITLTGSYELEEG